MAKELFTINNRSLASNFLSIKDIFLGSVSGRDAARKMSVMLSRGAGEDLGREDRVLVSTVNSCSTFQKKTHCCITAVEKRLDSEAVVYPSLVGSWLLTAVPSQASQLLDRRWLADG